MKLTPAFAKALRQKLSYGNARSILLNAHPGRLTSRLALTDLNLLSANTAQDFLNILVTQRTFSYKLNMVLEGKDEDTQKKLARLAKRISSIQYDHDDYYKEHGVETFSLGFPILLRRHPKDNTKFTAAPLFIFPLKLKQSFDKPNEWIAERDADSEIRLNEVLSTFMESEEHLRLPMIPEDMLEDGILDHSEIEACCKNILEKFSDANPASAAIKSLEPFPEKFLHTDPAYQKTRIIWNGVFGIYKSQKQNLVKEIDLLLENFSEMLGADAGMEPEWEHAHSPMSTDPSQNSVLRSLSQDKDLVIQGPPGTGKSQTLTAIIASALSNNKKVLVVCEKRTALEVLRSNLEKLLPDAAKGIALIEDVAKDRTRIVESVRSRTASMLVKQHQLQQMLLADIGRFEAQAKKVDKQYNALKTPVWQRQNLTWPSLVSKWIQQKPTEEQLLKLHKLQRLFTEAAITEQGYEGLQDAVTEGAHLCSRVYSYIATLSSRLKMAEGSMNTDAAQEAIITLKGERSDLQQIAQRAETLAKHLDAKTVEEVSQQMSLAAQQQAELSAILSKYIGREAEIEQPSFLARLLAIFSAKYKALLADSVTVKRLKENLGTAWQSIFSDAFDHRQAAQNTARLQGEKAQATERRINLQHQAELRNNPAFTDLVNAYKESCNSLAIHISMEADAPAGPRNLQELQQAILALQSTITELLAMETEIRAYSAWLRFLAKTGGSARKWIDVLTGFLPSDWIALLENAWLYHILLKNDVDGQYPTDDESLRLLRELGLKIKGNQKRVITDVIDQHFQSGQQRVKQLGLQVNQLYNLRGSKGNTRNSLRKIIHADLDGFTDFFPVLMLNPSVCSSIIPFKKQCFDLVIFDEASQLRIEDTFTAMLRGRQIIVSGDSRQMPPSSYFEGSGQVLGEDGVEDYNEDEEEQLQEEENKAMAELVNAVSADMAGTESLLQFAIDMGFRETYLDMHYRSRHPDLIEFSNTCFYGGRLVAMPELVSGPPIHYLHVNGLYDRNTNRQEAEEIIRLLREEIDPEASVGIATFNLTQRNMILDVISQERVDDAAFRARMARHEENGFFVKNLENIQGDERDVIIISTTFGTTAEGKFRMQFGSKSLGGKNGHRLLNVIITRAKYKLYVVTSIPEARTTEYRARIEATRKVDGVSGLLGYLNYAKAVSAGDTQERDSILQFIRQTTTTGTQAMDSQGIGLTESPFEEEVYSWLSEAIGKDRVILQYKCGGFRIDMVVLPKDAATGTRLAIECDGAAYHSSQLSWHYDIYRQEQLEQYGFNFHRIWSTNWWRKPDEEFQKLVSVIEAMG